MCTDAPRCRRCGFREGREARCPACGLDRSAPPAECPSCGREAVDNGLGFCRCGADLGPLFGVDSEECHEPSATNQEDPDPPGPERDQIRRLLAAGRRAWNAAEAADALPDSPLGRALLIRAGMLETEEGRAMLQTEPDRLETAVQESLLRCERGHSAAFRERQRQRGLASGYRRARKRDARRAKVWELFDEGWSVAKILNVRGTELGGRRTLYYDRRAWWQHRLQPRGRRDHALYAETMGDLLTFPQRDREAAG